jgi:hypothetical protein
MPAPSSTFRPPAFARTAAELQQHVERLGAGTVAAILRVDLVGDLDRTSARSW